MPASRALSEYGDKDNSDLAERFKISTDDFPQYRLWTKGKDSTKEPVKFTAAKKSEEFMKFIQTNAGVWVGLPGQVKELDALAKEFGSAKDKAPSPHPALHFSPAPQASAPAPSLSLSPKLQPWPKPQPWPQSCSASASESFLTRAPPPSR